MNYEEKQILDFLRPSPRVFFSVREIGKKAGSRRQFNENPEWPRPHLQFLTQQGQLQCNPAGHYCFTPAKEKEERAPSEELTALSTEEAAAKAAQEAMDPDSRPFAATPGTAGKVQPPETEDPGLNPS
ncbi:MAG TPA: hypothetical protein VK633_05970 [Verrucomicrobiae bacterium]|nr:hypothetical protein [Verrucomicrobiae bacterium]